MFSAEIGCRLSEVSGFLPMPGGAPANVAVAARRLGFSAAFIGKVGDDPFGRLLIDSLQSEGVETRGMRIDPEIRTTLAFIAMPDAQSTEFLFYRHPGADMRLRPDELDEKLPAGARAFHFGSISLGTEPIHSATLRAIKLAREAGALVSLDVNYRPGLWSGPEAAASAVRAVLPFVHLVKVNQAELVLLTGTDDPVAGSEAICHVGPTTCIVTLGADGSWYRVGAAARFAPAFAVHAVDATGCGDGFMAGVLVRLIAAGDEWPACLKEDTLGPAVRYGNAVGALTATQRGAIPALPTAAEVAAFLASRDEERSHGRT